MWLQCIKMKKGKTFIFPFSGWYHLATIAIVVNQMTRIQEKRP